MVSITKGDIIELLPHYLAVLLLTFLAVGILRGVVGVSGFLIELGAVILIVLVYPVVVRSIGVEPSMWKNR